MRLIQHKREAWWFYRFLSMGYDDWVNPLFWTERMRTEALGLARLYARELETLDAGAGTGFTTAGIVEHVDPARVTMLDQSPHQLARSQRRAGLTGVRRMLGDAERLPFDADSFDRYVSAGSIEYWPDPQRGIAEAYRVLREGGVGLVIGPVRPANPIARRLAETWMLFPALDEYRTWFEQAGFVDVEVREIAPDWYRGRGGRDAYAVAVSGVKPSGGPSPLAGALGPPAEDLSATLGLRGRLQVVGRFVAGSAAGAAFVPIAAALTLRAKLAGRRGG
jgi:MPBQ/MSBQ methyltransferase